MCQSAYYLLYMGVSTQKTISHINTIRTWKHEARWPVATANWDRARGKKRVNDCRNRSHLCDQEQYRYSLQRSPLQLLKTAVQGDCQMSHLRHKVGWRSSGKTVCNILMDVKRSTHLQGNWLALSESPQWFSPWSLRIGLWRVKDLFCFFRYLQRESNTLAY